MKTNLVAPVTAFKFIKPSSGDGILAERYLFAAIGNEVQIFAGEADEPLAIEEIFPIEYRIHGFSDIVKNRMIIYGGRIVAVVCIAIAKSGVDIKLQERTEFGDWVHGVHWLNDGRMIAVACGHSTTHICDSKDLDNSFVLQSEEKELTWSSTLFASTHGLRAVAGSSFGDVLSWTLLDPAQLKYAETLIFSKQNKTKSTNNELLPVHRLCAHDGPVMRLTISSDSRRLATASVDRTVRVWEAQKSDCTACAGECFAPILVHYGHLARVWDVSFISNRSVVSVGEDHSCRVWGEEAGNEIACYHGHTGRNIWSVSVCDGLVATGGEDGGVKVRSLSTTVTKGPFLLPRFENPRKKGVFNESGRSIVMIDHKTLLITTDFGRILRGRLERVMQWTEILRDDRGTAFTPCALVICGELLVAGQTDGNVVVLRDGQKTGDLKGEGMVMGLFADAGWGGCDVFIASANGTLSHWLIKEDSHVTQLGKYRMERVVKSSLVTAVCIARDAGMVITGDRGGRVSTYALLTHTPTPSIVYPSCTIRAHKDRVSTVHYSGGTVVTSSFDGAVTTLDVHKTELKIRSVTQAPDRTDTITRHSHGRILAFRGSTCVLWDLETRHEHVRADVGNWRRAHDAAMDIGVVGYWRGGGVYIARGVQAGWGRRGGNGGRITALALIPGGVVSAAEDGVSVWVDGTVVQRLSGHTSCVHGVAADGGIVASVGAKDEVCIWERSDGAWRLGCRYIVAELVGGDVVRAVCVGIGDGVVVGRSDGSVVRIVGVRGDVVVRVAGGALCLDCCDSMIVVGDTRGFVTVVHTGTVDRKLVHEGGVNNVKFVDGGDGWISAGDDGCVKYYKRINNEWCMVWTGTQHTAGVTGLAVGGAFIYSVGADQRVVSWTRSGCYTTTMTSIVDASSILCYTDRLLIIGGIGIQWLHICN